MELSFTQRGSGPPVVLLHGLLGSGDNLTSVARWIESDYTVYLPDLPNHGASPHTTHAGYDVMVSAVDGFIRTHSLVPTTLGGHSMGGKVAMRLALAAPELVRSLVVLDISPQRYQPSHTEIINAMHSLDLSHVKSRADADRKLEPAIADRSVRSFLLKNLERVDGGYRWRLNLDGITDDYHDILGWDGVGVYPGPALFVGGGKSKYLQSDRDEQLIRAHFPNALIRMIPTAGHWIHADAPDELEEILSDFLSVG